MASIQCVARMDTPTGPCRIYYLRGDHALQARIASRERPRRLVWSCTQPLPHSHVPVHRAQVALEGHRLIVRWHHRGRTSMLSFPCPLTRAPERPLPAAPVVLERTDRNPILQPRPDHDWEGLAVFNTAAIVLEGRVHFIYRAVGYEGLSVFGHASSRDGLRIDERSEQPVYVDSQLPGVARVADPAAVRDYCSGPNHSGSEDPRLTRIGERLFMTYTAFDGRHPPGVALTSISVSDFLAKRWQWAAPVLISPPHEAHKNWVVFPERIGSRYAVLHAISPAIVIDLHEQLDFTDGRCIQSHYACSGRTDSWDNRLRGAGPPPIRTPAGWLLLYHAMELRDPGRYKLGAMLLDLDDPSHILGRLDHPLLQPDAHYENDGFKSGVVYACGAALIGDRLHVYYGGADTVVCAATVPLQALLAQLRPAPSLPVTLDVRRAHDPAQARRRQPAAVGQLPIALGAHGGVQPQRGRARRHHASRLPGAVGPD